MLKAASLETKHERELLVTHISNIIETRKASAGAYANRELTVMYWEIGFTIREKVLNGERAEYGKKIVTEVASQLVERYGKSFDVPNLRRMIRFSEKFVDKGIVTELAAQLSWSHFIELLPLSSDESRLFYANEAAKRQLGTKELRRQISRKAFERREIGDANLSHESIVPFNVFKDPYFLDVLNLKDNYLEADLEKAILLELEAFLLEFGHGFTFVSRQKKMIIDGEDFSLDLLFYHRVLKRLVAVELKIGKFKAQYKGQMELYLGWLNRYERQADEQAPIGLILCTKASREQMELLALDKSGIAVAEFWTTLPSKDILEEKIERILSEAKERIERRRLLSNSGGKSIAYFYETKDED